MTAVAVTNNNTRLTDADATTGWASDGGGGAGPQNEPDLGYQLTSGSNYSVSRKVGTTKGGHIYTHGSVTDMTAAATQVVMCKCVWYNNINAVAYPACGIRVGNDTSNYHEYGRIAAAGTAHDGDLDADPKQLVYIIPIDPNVTAWPDDIVGTVTKTTIDAFGIQGDFGGSAKAENVAMDAIDLVGGDGVLWLVSGDGADADGTFDDFVAHDEGDATARYGHVSTVRSGVFEVFGKLWIGRTATPTATATEFTDSGKTLLFGAGFFDAGFTGIGVDLGGTGTAIAITDTLMKGQGQDNHKVYFDTIDEVDPTPDEITLSPAPPDFITAMPVVYNNDGGSDTIGLTSGNEYWIIPNSTTTFEMHSTRDNARTGATPIALSDGSTGEAHYIQRAPDIRPDLEITGTTGTFTATRTTFDNFRNITLTSACTFNFCTFTACELIDMTTNNGGSLQDCTLAGQTTEPGTALVQTNTTVNIDNCDFVLGDDDTGHAIEVDATGSMAFAGNTFTGYWASPNNEVGAEFHTQTGVDDIGEDVTTSGLHGFTSGDEVYYNDNGGTDAIGLTDGNRYYVNVISTTNISFHRSKHNALADTNRVGLTDGTTGETHTLYSANAAVVNTSGGAVTLTVTSGDTPSVRNVGVATTSIVATVDVDIHVQDRDLVDVAEADVYIQRSSPTALFAGAGNAAGDGDLVISGTIEADQPGSGFLSVLDVSLNKTFGYRYTSHDSTSTFTFPTTVSGSATSTGSGTSLVSTSTNFLTADIEEGDTIRNTTDGSYAVVDEIVDADNITTTALFSDGVGDDTWESGDGFSVHDLATALENGVDTVDAPLSRTLTDSNGDIATLSYDQSQAPTAIIIRVRSNHGATKYIPFRTSGTISATNGFSLDVTLDEDVIAT